MNLKKIVCVSLLGLGVMNGVAFASSVCKTERYMVAGQAYHGNVTCGQGSIAGLNVDGNVVLNGTVVKGSVTIHGKLTATNSTFNSDVSAGSLFAQSSTFQENVVSTGAVNLTQGSVINGDLTASSDLITIDATSSVKGKTLSS